MIDHRDRAQTAGRYSSNRLFEWVMAIMMLLIAFTLSLPGDTLSRGALNMLQTQLDIDEPIVAVILAAVGTLRCGALYANGNLPVYGPKARTLGSAVGALSWAVLMSTMIFDSLLSKSASIMVPVFGSLIIGEVVSAYRATRDGRFKSKLF